ncbi:MAG: SRPBCC domain-containing protein [Sandaracinaceae bacterium]
MSEPLRKTLRVRCGQERAFRVFTAQLDRWWPPDHRRLPGSRLELEGRVGGRFVERAGDREVEHGRVLRWEPPTRLTYSWFPGGGTGPTEVDVRFVGEGDHTRVEVVHAEARSGLSDAWPERVAVFARNWAAVLDGYVQAVEAADEGGGA